MLVYNYNVNDEPNYEWFGTNSYPVFPTLGATGSDIEVQFFPLVKKTSVSGVEYYDADKTVTGGERCFLTKDYTYTTATVDVAVKDDSGAIIGTVPNACVYGPVFDDRECTTQRGTENVYIALMGYYNDKDDTGASVVKAQALFPEKASVIEYNA